MYVGLYIILTNFYILTGTTVSGADPGRDLKGSGAEQPDPEQ